MPQGLRPLNFSRYSCQMVAHYLTGPDNTIVHTESIIGMPHKQSSASDDDEAAHPPSPAQVQGQGASGAQIDPLSKCSPTTQMPELADTAITTVEHKQSPASDHGAADPPSSPAQVDRPNAV